MFREFRYKANSSPHRTWTMLPSGKMYQFSVVHVTAFHALGLQKEGDYGMWKNQDFPRKSLTTAVYAGTE